MLSIRLSNYLFYFIIIMLQCICGNLRVIQVFNELSIESINKWKINFLYTLENSIHVYIFFHFVE